VPRGVRGLMSGGELWRRLEEQERELEVLREQRRAKDDAINFLKTRIATMNNRGQVYSDCKQGGSPGDEALEVLVAERERRIYELELRLESQERDIQLQLREQDGEVVELRQRLQVRDEQVHDLSNAVEELQRHLLLDSGGELQQLQQASEENQRLVASLEHANVQVDELQLLLRDKEQQVNHLMQEVQLLQHEVAEARRQPVQPVAAVSAPVAVRPMPTWGLGDEDPVCLDGNSGTKSPRVRPPVPSRRPRTPTASYGGGGSGTPGRNPPGTPKHEPWVLDNVPDGGTTPGGSRAPELPVAAWPPEAGAAPRGPSDLSARRDTVMLLEEEIHKQIAQHRHSFGGREGEAIVASSVGNAEAAVISRTAAQNESAAVPPALGSGHSTKLQESASQPATPPAAVPERPPWRIGGSRGSSLTQSAAATASSAEACCVTEQAESIGYPPELVPQVMTPTHSQQQQQQQSQLIMTPEFTTAGEPGGRPEEETFLPPAPPAATVHSTPASKTEVQTKNVPEADSIGQQQPQPAKSGAVSLSFFDQEDADEKKKKKQQQIARQIEQRRRLTKERRADKERTEQNSGPGVSRLKPGEEASTPTNEASRPPPRARNEASSVGTPRRVSGSSTPGRGPGPSEREAWNSRRSAPAIVEATPLPPTTKAVVLEEQTKPHPDKAVVALSKAGDVLQGADGPLPSLHDRFASLRDEMKRQRAPVDPLQSARAAETALSALIQQRSATRLHVGRGQRREC